MGHGELLTALRAEGERQANLIRREAAEGEEALRAEARTRLEELRRRVEERREALTAARRRELLTGAARDAARIRLEAEDALAVRLRERATACLTRLREGDADRLFLHLAAELPVAHWDKVRVHPTDLERATRAFPAATVICDPTISGGLTATTADGGLTVVNTMESRLERCWPDLAPYLVAELRGRPA